MPIATINPATGETVKTFTPASDAEVDAAIARAYERFLDYRHSTTFAQRAQWANATADLLEAEADEVAAMMTLEMGKTLKSAKAEALKCAKGFRYYAQNAEQLLADEPADAGKVGAARAYIRYQPLGVVLAVMPWNFPLWQAVRFAAPALMAGNVGILKHASNVPQSALYLADVITRGGFPEAASRPCWCRPARSSASCVTRGGRGHPDRQRTGRPVGGGHRRRRDQAHRARARRQRPVHRDALGRSG